MRTREASRLLSTTAMPDDLEDELLRFAARLPNGFTLAALVDELHRGRSRLAHPLLAHLFAPIVARCLVITPGGYTLRDRPPPREPAVLIETGARLPTDDHGLGLVERAWTYVQRC